MVVHVKFVGSFRSFSGKETLSVKLRCSIPLAKLVYDIVEKLPRLKSQLIDSESGAPRGSMLVLLNGREISVLKGFDTQIVDGDRVVFVPVVHGG